MKREQKLRKKKKKEERKKQRCPKLKLYLFANPLSYALRDGVRQTTNAPGCDLSKLFWKDIPQQWRRRVTAQYHKIDRMHPKDIEYFRNTSADSLEDILINLLCLKYPKYQKLNYSLRVHSPSLMRYDVYCEALETVSTSFGTVYLLPDVLFPPNKKVGLSTHAIERMDTRLFDAIHKKHGSVLRTSMILLPYKNHISALYGLFRPAPTMMVNGYMLPYYVLMGYMPIVSYDDMIVCKTHLRPGYDQTPEKGMDDKEISKNRILAIVDNTVHRMATRKVFRADAGTSISITTEPYDLSINPKVKLLLNIRVPFNDHDSYYP